MKTNELSCKDLMVGDWVMVNDIEHTHPLQVAEIFKKSGAYYATLYWDGMPDNVNPKTLTADIDKVLPIPLTPEILEKNGFVANKHIYPYPYYEYINKEDKLKVGFAFPKGNRTSYKDPWVYIDSERVFVEHLPCMFVHQLQHALRLCEIEKTIEL